MYIIMKLIIHIAYFINMRYYKSNNLLSEVYKMTTLPNLRPNESATFSATLTAIRQKRGFQTARSFYDYMCNYWRAAKEPIAITYATYAAYENGTRQPKLEVLAQLARFLTVSLDVLLNLYNENYILTFLHTHNYKAFAHGAHIMIHCNGNKILGIRKDIFLRHLQKGQIQWSQFIEHHINTLLHRTFKTYSEQTIHTGDRLIASAMALLLDIDFTEFEAQYEKSKQELSRSMIDNVTNALIFYYLTHTNPMEQPNMVRQLFNLADDYYLTGIFAKEYIEEHYPLDLQNMFYYSDTMKRIPYIDEYLSNLFGLHTQDPAQIKMAFFITLFYGASMDVIYEDNQLDESPTFMASSLYYSEDTSPEIPHPELNNTTLTTAPNDLNTMKEKIDIAQKLGLYTPKK